MLMRSFFVSRLSLPAKLLIIYIFGAASSYFDFYFSFLVLMVGAFFVFYRYVSPAVLVFLLAFDFFIISAYVLFFNNTSGVDEAYFYSTYMDSDFFSLVQDELHRLSGQFGYIRSRNTFPAFLDLFFSLYSSDVNSALIIYFNSFFWLAGLAAWLKAIEGGISRKAFIILFIYLFASPYVLYWIFNFGKDLFVVSLCLISSAFFIRKRYVCSLLFLCFASFFRPYSAVIVLAYSAPFCLSFGRTTAMAAGAVFVQALLSKSVVIVLLNSLLIFLFVFLSPSPFNFDNWSYVSYAAWHFSPWLFTFEGVLVFLFFCLGGVSLIFWGRTISQFGLLIKILIAVFLLCLVLGLVGQSSILSSATEPRLGLLGDNIVRKKLAVWPLVALFVAIIFSKIRVIKSRKLKCREELSSHDIVG